MNDEFQPRVEDPPDTKPTSSDSIRLRNERLREFVRKAAGKWCIVCEKKDTTKKNRTATYAKMWAAFRRLNGYEDTGFELRAHYIDKVYKVYARFDASKIVKSPQ